MIRQYILGSTVAASMLLVGCSSSDSTTDTISSTTGYVVDSAVENLNYDCVADGTENHATGKDGAFTCQNMSQVRFRIGDLILGEIHALPADGYVFPQDIAGVNRSDVTNNAVTAMAQLLQSLDEDGNLDNGIQIPEGVQNAFENEAFNAEDLDTYMGQASVAPQRVRTRTRAQQHIRDTMQELNATVDHVAFDINNYPVSTNMSEELNTTVAYMGNEERLAYDVYMNLYTLHMNNGEEIKQMLNIAEKAESKHIDIVQSIVNRYNLDGATLVTNPVADSNVTLAEMPSGVYGIPALQTFYDTLYAKGQLSKQDALEVGCMIEVTDVNDLDADIELAIEDGAEDIVAAYNVLRDGSYNHYWAFDKGLKNMGVTDGCCSLGADYCRPEYPQNENGQGNN